MIGTRKFAILALVIMLSGCKVGPNYKRPVLATPDQYRGVAPDLSNQPGAQQPFAEMQWESVFQDETLRALIKEALMNNYDMQIAASRIVQSEAVVGVTRANQLPSVFGSGGINYERNAIVPNGPTIDSLSIQLNYIVDFWGKYRRATEAARAQLLATTYARDVVQTTLISDVATTYFQLRQFDYQLDFAQKTVVTDKDAVQLNTVKFKGGDSAITDVYQAEILLQQAEAQVILSQEQIAQAENQSSILLGRNPGPIARGLGL